MLGTRLPSHGLYQRGLGEQFRFYNEPDLVGHRLSHAGEVFHGKPVVEESKEKRISDQPDLVPFEGVQESNFVVA